MRSKFTATGVIPVTDIKLDTKNYRIGEAEDQSDCIELIFRAFGTKMERIAQHISLEGLSPKPIVVQKVDSDWVVKDGNRRVCALQLLNNPALAPESYRPTFLKLKADHFSSGNIPSEVDCLTSTDHDAIQRYMRLEHMGEQEGAGQVDWGSREKDNLAADTGTKPSSPEARIVLAYLQKQGVEEAKTVKITNVQRLLQDSYVQGQLGLIFQGENLTFTLNEEETKKALTEIVLDFSSRKVKVGAIYDKSDRESYIDTLLGPRGFRPSPVPVTPAPGAASPAAPAATATAPGSTISPTPPPTAPSAPGTSPIPVPTRPPRERPRLIPRGQGLRVPTTEPKVLSVINELSSKIDVRDAPISAGVLLRLLIEFSVSNYLNTNAIVSGNELYKKIAEAGKHMLTAGKIDKKQNELLAKMCKSDELLSAHTLNQYVHSTTYMPTGRDLTTFWDNLYFFLRACW